MSEWKLPWEGRCRCGQVVVRVTQPPIMSSACHCTGCQRMSASAFSLTLMLPARGFEVVAGEPVVGGLHGGTRHMFCGHCMSWMFTRPEGLDWLVNLRPTMLDDSVWFEPFIETQTAEKLPWAKAPAAHSFARFPEPSAYEALMREFATQSKRPGDRSSAPGVRRMTRGEVEDFLRTHEDKRVRITWQDGESQVVQINAVDQDGVLHSGPDGIEQRFYWTRFESVVGLAEADEGGIAVP